MKTAEQIKAALPERLRQYDVPRPISDIDDANLLIAYLWASLEAMTDSALSKIKVKQAS